VGWGWEDKDPWISQVVCVCVCCTRIAVCSNLRSQVVILFGMDMDQQPPQKQAIYQTHQSYETLYSGFIVMQLQH